MTCIVCRSHETEVLYPRTLTDDDAAVSSYQITESAVGKHEEMVKCKKCSLVFVSSLPFKNSHSYYEDQSRDTMYSEEQENRKRVARNILKKIETLCPGRKGRLMDMGCSTGTFISVAQDQGWEVFGSELSTWAVSQAKKDYGIDVLQGSFFDTLSTFPDAYFDVVVTFDVIEHVEQPDEFVKLIHQKLIKGGLLVLGTPNIESAMARITKDKWYAIVPSHLFYFSPKTIRRLLSTYQFSDVKVKTHTRFFSLWYIGYRLEGFSFVVFRIVGKILKIPLLRKIVIPINLGQEMEVYARKK